MTEEYNEPDFEDIEDFDDMLKKQIEERLTSKKKAAPKVKTIAKDFGEITTDDVADILNTTIVHDREAKILTFLTMVLNYTEEDQQNVGFQSASATGKTHIVLNVAEYFPKEDVDKIGYITPQAFFHKYGDLEDEEGNPLQDKSAWVKVRLDAWVAEQDEPEHGEKTQFREDKNAEASRLKEEWEAIPKRMMVDLHQKILIAIDMPSDLVLQRIRPLLSHDDKYIKAEIADKNSSGQQRTKTTVLVGFPTFFSLSASYSADEQEKNRMFLLSADTSKSKIENSLIMAGRKLADRRKFRKGLDSDIGRIALMERIVAIKEAEIEQIIIPDKIIDEVTRRFLKEHPTLTPRLQRDYPRLVAIIKAHALINLWTRKREDNIIYANESDAKVGYELYNLIAEANERGLTPSMWKFFVDILRPFLEGVGSTDRKTLSKMWKDEHGEILSYKNFQDLVYGLVDAGLIDYVSDPDDGRKKIIVLANGEAPKKKEDKGGEQTDLLQNGDKEEPKKENGTAATLPEIIEWVKEQKNLPKFIMSMSEYNKFGAEALRRGMIESLGKGEYRVKGSGNK